MDGGHNNDGHGHEPRGGASSDSASNGADDDDDDDANYARKVAAAR